MALDYGAKPTSGSSTLTGLSAAIYTNLEPDFVTPGIAAINNSVAQGMPADKAAVAVEDIQKQTKLLSYSIAKSIVDYFKSNAVVDVTINNSSVAIHPVPTPGTGTGGIT